MEEPVLNVPYRLPIVIYVHQQRNAQPVQINIIQQIMEPVVHCVHQRNVHTVIQRVECVQNVNRDII